MVRRTRALRGRYDAAYDAHAGEQPGKTTDKTTAVRMPDESYTPTKEPLWRARIILQMTDSEQLRELQRLINE